MSASQTPSARIRKSVKELYPTEEAEEPKVEHIHQPSPPSVLGIEPENKQEGSAANLNVQGSTTKTISGKTTRQSIPTANVVVEESTAKTISGKTTKQSIPTANVVVEESTAKTISGKTTKQSIPSMAKIKSRPSMGKELGRGVLGDKPQEKKKSFAPAPPPTTAIATATKGHNTNRRKDLGMFCTQQIQIPPFLPGILKAFAKAAIRTQPDNLQEWSISYFKCMANGEIPPVKDRLEFMPDSATEGLTIGLLQVLHKQLRDREYVTFQELREKWRGICMKEKYLVKTWKKGKLDKHRPTEWKQVISLLCTLQGRNMNETMDAVCQVLSLQPVGGEPFLEWDEFWGIYVTLAQIDGRILQTTVEEVRDYLKPIALANHGLIGPRDFKNQNAPSLF